MGSLDMLELKQSFVKLVRKVAAPQMPQFVIWLDVKLAEYKLNGFMRLDDDHTPGQSWMELFMNLPSETSTVETNGTGIRIKEEPPDLEPSAFNLLFRTSDTGSRKSSVSDQGNCAQDSDNMAGSMLDSNGHQSQMRNAVDSVSMLRNSIQAQGSLYGKHSRDNIEYSWHRTGGEADSSRQPAFPGMVPSGQSGSSVSNISRPITLMDLKSSAKIPTIPSLSAAPSSLSISSELECPLCHKISKDERALRRHMSAHRQPSDYPCNQCGRSFSLRMQLRRHNCSANVRHMQRSPTMSPTHPYASPPAARQASYGAALSSSKFKPIRFHHHQPPDGSLLKLVSCDECGRRFSRQQDLARHVCTKPVSSETAQSGISTHNTPNSEVMTLLSLTQLNKSRMSADYPITCSSCGWSFSRRQDLRRHKCSGDIRKLLNKSQNRTTCADSPNESKIHMNNTEYQQLKDLDDGTSSSPKPKKYEYMCAKCGSNFYTEDELQNHIDKCILEENGSQSPPNCTTNTGNDTADNDDDDNNAEEESAENSADIEKDCGADENDEDEDFAHAQNGAHYADGNKSAILNYQGSGTTNPSPHTTTTTIGLWSVNEDSLGGTSSTAGNQRQSKRKKAVPQKVETMATNSPGRSDDTCVQSDGEAEIDDVLGGDVIEVDDVIGSESAGTQLILRKTFNNSGKDVNKSPRHLFQRVRRGQAVRQKVQGQGRDSDGDTDEEMFFQVNNEGVITWQGSNLPASSPGNPGGNDPAASPLGPASDLGLVSAYQLDKPAATVPGTIAGFTTPGNFETCADGNGAGILIGHSSRDAIVSAATKSADSTVSAAVGVVQAKTVAVGKKTAKKRRRNNNGPYECKVCHKLFAQSSSRNRHTKLHYGIYDYACDVCGRQFARREHLKTHANKCPGAIVGDNTQPQSGNVNPAPSATTAATTAATYSLLQESFGDIIMIQ